MNVLLRGMALQFACSSLRNSHAAQRRRGSNGAAGDASTRAMAAKTNDGLASGTAYRMGERSRHRSLQATTLPTHRGRLCRSSTMNRNDGATIPLRISDLDCTFIESATRLMSAQPRSARARTSMRSWPPVCLSARNIGNTQRIRSGLGVPRSHLCSTRHDSPAGRCRRWEVRPLRYSIL